MRMKICSIITCNSKVRAKNLCHSHYNQDRTGGLWNHFFAYYQEVDGVEVQKRMMSASKPHTEAPAYSTVHKRLTTQRGKAANYQCVDGMDHAAEDWSLEPGTGELEQWSPQKERWQPYSADLGNYSPRCRTHHRILDAGRTTAAVAGYTATEPASGGDA